jgi:CheY-like chemotaxis protein
MWLQNAMHLAVMTPDMTPLPRMTEWEKPDYILVVEDDIAVSETFTEVLEEEGHRVVCFDDGRPALEYLRQKSILPQLIFLDFLMPHMNGWQFLAERRRDRRIAEVPVVGVSASDRVDEDAARSVVELLRKPVSLDALLGAVRRCAVGSFGL